MVAGAPSPGAATGALASDEQVAGAVRRALAATGSSQSPEQALEQVRQQLDEFRRAHPQAGPLDGFQLTRLVTYALDPGGTAWMEAAGLLGSDSCGYPVAGGYYEVRGDVAATPQAQADPALTEYVLERLRKDWSADYIQTGSADLERTWRQYL